MRHRHELTETQWEQIRDLLPGQAGDPGRTAVDDRLVVNAVLYVLKTGVPWADLPVRFGKSNTVWKRFDRWYAAGVWKRVALALSDPDLEEVQLVRRVSKHIPSHQPVGASRLRRRRAGPAALFRSQPGRVDNQITRRGGSARLPVATAGDRRSMWRCSASRRIAERTSVRRNWSRPG